MTAGTENSKSTRPTAGPRIVWRPNRIVATIFMVVGGAAVIVSEIGGDRSVVTIFQKVAVAAAVCGVLGYLGGFVLRLIFTEMADPDVPEFLEIPRDLEGLKKIRAQQARGRESEQTPETETQSEEEVSSESQNQREGVMVSTDST